MIEKSFCDKGTHARYMSFGHLHVLDPELHGLGSGEAERQHPYRDDEADGSGEFGHRVREEGVADGHVAFHGEGGDGEDCGVGGGFSGKALEDAEGLAKDISAGRPNPAQEGATLNYII